MSKTGPARRIVLPFSDDSTLVFALAMRRLLLATTQVGRVELWHYLPEDALSRRQLDLHLPEGADRRVEAPELAALLRRDDVAGVITNRMYRPLNDGLQDPALWSLARRPALVAFQGGLEFFPETCYLRRRFADAVFLLPRDAPQGFAAVMQARGLSSRPEEFGFGHPAFVRPAGAPDPGGARDVVFFAQALSPSTRRARRHMLEVLAAIARRNPDRQVVIKLRHLPDENRKHIHRERHDYPGLLARLPEAPENLVLSTESMASAVARTGIGITCTSTAAADLVSAGKPCMVYLDYVDHYLDPLAAAMRGHFGDSGLIRPIEDVLNLAPQAPDAGWLDRYFCPPDLGRRVVEVIDRFHARLGAG